MQGSDEMVIDYHGHLWPPGMTPGMLQTDIEKRKGKYDFNADGLLKSMEENGIAQTVVSALAFSGGMENTQIRKLNDYVWEARENSGEKLKAFCTLNPLEEGAEDFLRFCMEDKDFDGLKLHCNMQEFYPDDQRLEPIYKRMEKYGKPILFHSGGIGILPYQDDFGRPVRFDAAASRHPDLTIILGHAGRIWYQETAMLLRKHKNVYADISTNFGKTPETAVYPMKELLKIVKGWAGSTKHLVFGSDFPFYEQGRTKTLLEKTACEAGTESLYTERDVKEILYENRIRTGGKEL